MDFKSYLKESADLLDTQLQEIFASWRQDAKEVSDKLLPIVDVSIDACGGGKRLRGVLVKLGYELAGGDTNNKEILKPAAAFEIFQTAILAHDDVIDLSPLRRGKPTIYKALGGDHYGISQAICVGDVGFFLAFRVIADSNFSSEYKTKAFQSFMKSMLETALGQMLDVSLSRPNIEKNEHDAMTISELKTARYTITGPLQLGAILAGVSEKLLDQLDKLGTNLGIAYQIQDDILGIFGLEEELGKSVTSDIEEGKNTLLITKALENSDKEQRQFLKDCYGKGKISGDKVKRVKEIFEETKALDYAKQKAEELVKQSKQIIQQMIVDERYKSLLNEFAVFLIKRTK